MRVLVTGASGFLGRAVCEVLEDGAEVIPHGHTKSRIGGAKADLRDKSEVFGLVEQAKPDAVIHCAAYREPDWCELNLDETRRLNIDSTRFLTECLPPATILLQISTDYVFDGNSPPYGEGDNTNPLNVYGSTKVQAEKAALSHPAGAVLRIPFLVGAGAAWEASGFIYDAVQKIRSGQPFSACDSAVRYPTSTQDVARFIAFLFNRFEPGIYHFSGERCGTKFTLMKEMVEILRASADHLKPDACPGTVAKRPHNANLCTTKIRQMGYSGFTDFRTVVEEAFSKFDV